MGMKAGRALGAVAGAALASLAGGCLDLLGHEEDVIEHRSNEGMLQLEDDRIEDKHPTYDAQRTVTESFKQSYGACAITMNKSAAVTKLDIVPFEAVRPLDKRLFPRRTDALATIAGIRRRRDPSMEVVNGALAVQRRALRRRRAGGGVRQAPKPRAGGGLTARGGVGGRPLRRRGRAGGRGADPGGELPAIDASEARARNRVAAPEADRRCRVPSGSTPEHGAGAGLHRIGFCKTATGESGGAFAAIAFVLAGRDAARRLPARRRHQGGADEPVHQLHDRRVIPTWPARWRWRTRTRSRAPSWPPRR